MDFCTDSMLLIAWELLKTALTVYGFVFAFAGAVALGSLVCYFMFHVDNDQVPCEHGYSREDLCPLCHPEYYYPRKH